MVEHEEISSNKISPNISSSNIIPILALSQLRKSSINQSHRKYSKQVRK